MIGMYVCRPVYYRQNYLLVAVAAHYGIEPHHVDRWMDCIICIRINSAEISVEECLGTEVVVTRTLECDGALTN